MAETTITQAQYEQLMAKLARIERFVDEQERRQRERDELKQDLIPIGNQIFRLAIDELAEIGMDFQLEDLLFLLKRLLRDIPLLLKALDQLEALMGLNDELQRLTRPMFNRMVQALDRMERAGHFALAQSAWQSWDRLAQALTPEDLARLGQQAETLAALLRALTDPTLLERLQQALALLQAAPAEDEPPPSLWALSRELRDPQVRRGLQRALRLAQALA